MKKNIITILILFAFLGLFSMVNAWTGPTSAPPGGNIAEPLNISNDAQTKAGYLYFPKWFDANDDGYYVDPASNSWLYRLYSYDVRSDIFYDRNNTGYYVDPASTSILNNLNINGKITGAGAETSYGALTIDGTKNSYSGINFKSGSTNYGTLMVHPDYQGFYNNSDNGWDWYFVNGTMAAGTIPWERVSGAPVIAGPVGPQGPAGAGISCTWTGCQNSFSGVSCGYWCGGYSTTIQVCCSGGIITSMSTASVCSVCSYGGP